VRITLEILSTASETGADTLNTCRETSSGGDSTIRWSHALPFNAMSLNDVPDTRHGYNAKALLSTSLTLLLTCRQQSVSQCEFDWNVSYVERRSRMLKSADIPRSATAVAFFW